MKFNKWTIALAAPGALLFVLFLLFSAHYPALARVRSTAGTARTARGRMRCGKSITRSPMFSGYGQRVRFCKVRKNTCRS